MLPATGEDERAVATLRAATHHPRRQAPLARRPRPETHLARLRAELRELDRELPATLNADHTLHPGSAPAAPSPRPAAMPMATSMACRTHLINEPMQSSASQLLDHQKTPTATASASLPSPSPPALRALPSTHALRAPLALPYGPDDQVRKVQAGGLVSFQGRHLRVPKALRGQAVAFRPTATDGSWAIRFLTDDLRTLDPREPAQECSPCLRTPVHHVSGLDTSTHLTTSVLRM